MLYEREVVVLRRYIALKEARQEVGVQWNSAKVEKPSKGGSRPLRTFVMGVKRLRVTPIYPSRPNLVYRKVPTFEIPTRKVFAAYGQSGAIVRRLFFSRATRCINPRTFVRIRLYEAVELVLVTLSVRSNWRLNIQRANCVCSGKFVKLARQPIGLSAYSIMKTQNIKK